MSGGSVQLRTYRQMRRAMTREDAARSAGISIGEAELIDKDDERAPPPAAEPIPTLAGSASTTTKEPVMARKKKGAESVVKTPDFNRAIDVMREDIAPSIEDSAKTRGDLSAAWKVIEKDCHCNKAAAKQVNSMLGMTTEKRDDYLRSLYGLMKAAGLGISKDLVDAMGEGDAPDMPVVDPKPMTLHTVN